MKTMKSMKSSNNKKKQPQKSGNQAPKPANKIRDPGSIIRALANNGNKDSYSNPYMSCRMNGMTTNESPSIPDGASGRHICTCLYTIDRIVPTVAGQVIKLQFNPWVPASGFVSSSGLVMVNGIQFSSDVIAPIGVPTSFRTGNSDNYPGSPLMKLDVYNATGMRIVSQTHKIMYTGPVTTASGVLRGFENNMSLDSVTRTTSIGSGGTPPASGTYFLNKTSGGTTLFQSPVQTEVYSIDGGVPVGLPVGTVSVRPEQGMMVRLKHRTSAFASVPVNDIPYGVTADHITMSTAGAVLGLNNYLAAAGGYAGGLIAHDNDWNGVQVWLDGINGDASYSIETMVCVEFQPSASSPFYPLAKESVKKNEILLDRVEQHIKTVGSITPMSTPN